MIKDETMKQEPRLFGETKPRQIIFFNSLTQNFSTFGPIYTGGIIDFEITGGIIANGLNSISHDGLLVIGKNIYAMINTSRIIVSHVGSPNGDEGLDSTKATFFTIIST